MLFTQPLFLAFFTVVFALAWLDRDNRRRKWMLLAASYVFYSAWDWRFLGLILLATIVDFNVGRVLGRIPDGERRRRRAWLQVSLCVDLGVLGFFKYFGFFVDSATALLRGAGFDVGDRALSIVLPVGISFYTFQSMSYTIDVYRRRMTPVGAFTDYALFVSFFPQLVAGPIVRARSFLPQLDQRPLLASVRFRQLLALFVSGFVKKVCIADRIAPLVDTVFAQPAAFDALAIWVAVLSYAVQIYCDFSGYTDMAIATAGLLGYQLVRNFDAPYLARNPAEFWRRWHISLSSWLRDYLYIPLGGNRGTARATRRNVMLTMLLGGLWHGAAWTFAVWGLWHGLWLVAHRKWRELRPERPPIPGARVLGVAGTLYVVCVGWIFFRAQSFADALALLKGFVLFRGGPQPLDPLWLLGPALLLLLHAWIRRARDARWMERLPGWAFGMLWGAALGLALAFAPLRSEPFIYFQF